MLILKINFKNKKIILIYFQIKNILKNNRHCNSKQALNLIKNKKNNLIRQ
jgi:hypothetical protein